MMADDVVALVMAKLAAETQLSKNLIESITVDEHRDTVANALTYRLRATAYRQDLPPQRVIARTEDVHPEAIGAWVETDDPRWATWRDHFWATHHRLARLLRRTPKTVMTKVRNQVAGPVRCAHEVRVDILDSWVYPEAKTTFPLDMGFGYPVLKSNRVQTWGRSLYPYASPVASDPMAPFRVTGF